VLVHPLQLMLNQYRDNQHWLRNFRRVRQQCHQTILVRLVLTQTWNKKRMPLALTGLQPKVISACVDSDNFTTVTRKKRPTPGSPAVNTSKHALNQSQKFCLSLRISEKESSKALFVSRFSAEVTDLDVENSLKEQLCPKNLVWTRQNKI
jgi:hypothetical protein